MSVVVNVQDILRRSVDMQITDRLEYGPQHAPDESSYMQGVLYGSMALVELLKEQGYAITFTEKINAEHIAAEIERLTR